MTTHLALVDELTISCDIFKNKTCHICGNKTIDDVLAFEIAADNRLTYYHQTCLLHVWLAVAQFKEQYGIDIQLEDPSKGGVN